MILERTVIGHKVVSTIKRDEELKAMDEVLGFFDELLPERANLSEDGDYETMVFHCDSDGEVTYWTELDFARYNSEEEAKEGHRLLVEKWG